MELLTYAHLTLTFLKLVNDSSHGSRAGLKKGDWEMILIHESWPVRYFHWIVRAARFFLPPISQELDLVVGERGYHRLSIESGYPFKKIQDLNRV